MTLNERILSKVNREDIYRYLNAKQAVEASWVEFVDQVLVETLSLIAPVYTSVKSDILIQGDRVQMTSYDFEFSSRQFSKHINGSDQVIIVAATLGHGIERKIKYYFTTNPTRAIVMDACGSALIEAYCDEIEEELLKEAASAFRGFTSRFSPGYGDLSLSFQRSLFERFDLSKKTGIHLSQGDLMIPQKSVVFMVANHQNETETLKCSHKCALCTLKHCIYRQEEGTNVKA